MPRPRIKITGYVDAEDDDLDEDGEVSEAGWDTIGTLQVNDLEDLDMKVMER